MNIANLLAKKSGGGGGAAEVSEDMYAESTLTPLQKSWRVKVLRGLKRKVQERQELTSVDVGTGAKMNGSAFGILSDENRFRITVFKLTYSQPFEYFLMAVIFLHLCVLSLRSGDEDRAVRGVETDSLRLADIAFNAFYTIEMVMRCIALGVGPESKDTYLRGSGAGYNRLDFVVVVLGWFFIIAKEPIRLASFRIFRSLLALKSFRFISAIIAITDALSASLEVLVDVFAFSAVCLAFYGLMGMNLFAAVLQRRCVLPVGPVNATYANLMQPYQSLVELPTRYGSNVNVTFAFSSPENTCGSDMVTSYATATPGHATFGDGYWWWGLATNQSYDYERQTNTATGSFSSLEAADKGFTCPSKHLVDMGLPPMVCSRYVGNIAYEANSFDDFPHALITMFQVITLEGWNIVAQATIDAEYKISVWYYITLIILGTYFLVSVFVAAVSGVFLRLRREHQALITMKNKREDLKAKSGLQSALALINALEGKGGNSASGARGSVASGGIAQVIQLALAKRKARRIMEKSGDPEASVTGVNSEGGAEEEVAEPEPKPMLAIAEKAVTWKHFGHASGFFVVLNTLVLCGYSYENEKSTNDSIDGFAYLMIAVFVIETFLRTLASPTLLGHIRQSHEAVDIAVVILAVIGVYGGMFPNITPLRMLRWFRPRKGVKQSEQTVLEKVLASLDVMVTLFLFLCLTTFAFAVMGMQLLGGRFTTFQEGNPRDNFDTLPEAFMTMFFVTTGERWVDIMWNSIRVGGWTGGIAPFFFAVFFVLTNYVTLNLIIAVILENMELPDYVKRMLQREEIEKRAVNRRASTVAIATRASMLKNMVAFVLGGFRKPGAGAKSVAPEPPEIESPEGSPEVPVRPKSPGRVKMTQSMLGGTDAMERASTPTQQEMEERRRSSRVARKSLAPGSVDAMSIMTSTAAPSGGGPRRGRRASLSMSSGLLVDVYGTGGAMGNKPNADEVMAVAAAASGVGKGSGADIEKGMAYESPVKPSARQRASGGDSDVLPAWIRNDVSLHMFPTGHPVRMQCLEILSNKIYRYSSIVAIALSCFTVMMMEPVGVKSDYDTMILSVNAAVMVYFLFDFLINVIAHGFIFTLEPYILNGWNTMDLVLLIIDVLALFKWAKYYEYGIRAALSLRPLRLLNRFESMRELFGAIIKTMPSIVSVFMLSAVVFLAFDVFAVQQYSGKFFSCNDDSVNGRYDCVGTTIAAIEGAPSAFEIAVPKVWDTPFHNFDDAGRGMLTLVEVASLDEWVDVMFDAMDVTKLYEQPKTNNSWGGAIFFILFVAIGSFLVVRTFIGVFIDQFGFISGSKLLTERQKLWRDMRRIIETMKPRPARLRPTNPFKRLCYLITEHPRYPTVALVVITLDCALQMTYTAGQSNNWAQLLRSMDALFTIVYFLEIIVRVFAYRRFRRWMSYNWNLFEVVIAVGSLFTIYAEEGSGSHSAGRPFRFLRTFRVIRFVPGLNTLLNTIIISMPSLISVVGLLLIVMFIYAGAGTQLFADVKYGESLNRHANFKTFSSSGKLLFQVMTAEGWRGLMNDVGVDYPYCTATPELNDCGYPMSSTSYFVSFVIVCTYIFTNLFVAAILDNITFGLLNEAAIVQPRDLMKFQEVWESFDISATGYLKIHRLGDFMEGLGAPLGRTRPFPVGFLQPVYYEAHYMHVEGKGIPFTPLCETVLNARLGLTALTYDVRKLREAEVEEIFEYGASVVIQKFARGFLVRSRLARLASINAAARSAGSGEL